MTPLLLLGYDDELIDDGFDIVNMAHELLNGARSFPLAYAALQQRMKIASKSAGSTRNATPVKSLTALALAVLAVACDSAPASATPLLGTTQRFEV